MMALTTRISQRMLRCLSIAVPALGLAVIAALWLALQFFLNADLAHATREAEVKTRGLTQAFEEYSQKSLEQVDKITRFIAYSYRTHGNLDMAALVREGVLDQPGFIAVFVVDQHGDVVATSFQGAAQSNVADREYFKLHQEGKHAGLHIGQPLLGRVSQRWNIPMSRRLSAPDGSFAGVVVVSMDPSYFTSFYNETQMGRQGLVSIIGKDFVLRARRSGDRVWFGQQAGQTNLAKMLAQAPAGDYVADSTVDGVGRFLSYKTLAAYPMIVYTGLAQPEVLAPHLALKARLTALCVAASLFVLAGFAALQALVMRLQHSQAMMERNRVLLAAGSNAQLDAFFILKALRDDQGHITDFACVHGNDRAAQMLGHAKPDLLAKPLGELMGDQADPAIFALYSQVTESRTMETAEKAMLMPLGVEVWLHYQVVPVADGVGVTVRDMSDEQKSRAEVRQAREAAQQSARYLHAITDNLPALVAYVGKDERYQFANRYFSVLLKMDPADVVGKTMHEVRGDRPYARALPHIQAALRGEPARYRGTGDIGGSLYHFEANFIPDRDETGEVRGFFAMTFDISTLREAELQLQRSEQRLRAITDHLPVLISYLDADLRFRFANRTYQQWFGVDPAQLLGQSLQDFYGEAVWREVRPHMEAALAGREVTYERVLHSTAGRRHVHATLVPERDAEGRVTGVHTLLSDVTAQREASEALRASEARLRTVADALPVRVAYIDADERYRFNNLAYERGFGLSREEIEGRTVRQLLGEATYQVVAPHIRAALGGAAVSFQSEITLNDTYTCYEAQYIPQRAADGETVLGFHAVITDITRQKREERRLVQLARVDALTGLTNRAGFEPRLAEAMARVRESGALMALLYLDIDKFKQVNDTLGHGTGDALLKAFATRLTQAMRATDFVARLGGDEFVAIMEDLPRPDVAARVGEKIVAAMRTVFVLDGEAVQVSTSIGLAFYTGDPLSTEALVQQADAMLYRAKGAGRDNLQY